MKCPVCDKNLAGPLKAGGQPACPGCGWVLPKVTQKASDTSGLSRQELEAALAKIDEQEDEAESIEKIFNPTPKKAAKRGRGDR